MWYVVSDIHGEYELFLRLMDKIRFSSGDRLFVCGDMIDKGQQSVRLLKLLSSLPNAQCILGNHEHDFLRQYWAIMKQSPEDFGAVLEKLRSWFPRPDGGLLEWELVDWLESLPLYLEEEQFYCVHAGVPLDDNRRIVPPESVPAMRLVEDRQFMRPEVVPEDSKCVFFGHTPTRYLCDEDRILAYRRRGSKGGRISDYYKVHMDTGTWLGGVLGCFRIDDCTAFYVKKSDFRK